MIMRKIFTLVLFVSALFVGMVSRAQNVTTNGGSGLAATYATLDAAFTALNAATITSPVVINLVANETSPAAGYVITAQGTSTNTITINGGGFTITGNNGLTAGAFNDGIFKLRGADWVTLQGFNIVNNGNTANGIGAGINTRYEFGIALFVTSTTNGAQNNTIQNNTIDMAGAGGVYANTFAIFSTSASLEASLGTTSSPTNVSGTNSGNKFYSNTITNTSHGIVVLAQPANSAAVEETGVEVGGAAAGTGNTITFAASTTASGTISLSNGLITPFSGIQVRNSNNSLVSRNTVTMTSANVLAATAISVNNSLNQSLAGTRAVSNNTVLMKFTNVFASNAQIGIDLGTGATAGGTLLDQTATQNNITIEMDAASGANVAATVTGIRATTQTQLRYLNNNTIRIGHIGTSTVVYSGAHEFINVNGTGGTVLQCNNNNLNSGATGYSLNNQSLINGINLAGTAFTTSVNIDGNTINLERTNTGTLQGFFGIATTNTATVPQSISTNNITLRGSGAISTGNAIRWAGGGANTTKTIENNIITLNFSRDVSGTEVAGIFSQSGRSLINGNTIAVTTATIGTAVTGAIRLNGNTPGISSPSIVSGNTINVSSSSSNTSQSLTGILVETSNTHTVQVVNNNIQSIVSSTTTSSVSITITGIRFNATTFNATAGRHLISGNIIGGLSSSNNGTSTNVQSGITIGSGTGATSSEVDILNNVIGGFLNRHGTATIAGMTILTGQSLLNIANNRIALVGNILPNSSSAATTAIGIDNQSTAVTSTYNLYHNTIHLNVSSSITNLNSSAFNHRVSSTATTAAINLRNNIFENISATGTSSGSAVALRLNGVALNNYATTSDNNFYYAGTAAANRLIFFDGTNSDQTIAAFKTRVGPTRETNSQPTGTLANVPFLSTDYTNANFLKIDPNGNTDVSNNAVLITGYTTDFEGDTRPAAPATNSDIGADEYVVTCPRPTTPPSITLTNTGSGEITVNFGASVPTAPTGGYIIVRNTTGVAPTVTDGDLTTLGGGGGTIISTQATNAAYVDGGLVNGTTYHYFIFAYNAGGCSGTAWWNTTPRSGSLTALVPCVTPGNPGAVTVGSPTTASLNVSWLPASPVPTGYLVIRTLGATAPTGLPPVNGTTYTVGAAAFGGVIDYVGSATSYISGGLLANQQYTYTVFSFNGSCGGAPVYSAASTTNSGTTTTCLAPGTYVVGPAPSNYTSITQVEALLFSCGLATGNYIFELKSDYVSTVETFPITFRAFTGSGAGARVIFRPRTGASNLQITGSVASSLINFNAARFVEFDGRPGGTGASLQLTIMNTNTGAAPAVSFTSEANNNVLQHLNIRSANSSSTSATVVLGATSTNGHRNITITNNHIFDATTGTPANGIGSFANTTITARYNQNIVVTNNQIYNYHSATGNTSGILIDDGATAWTITGNSFYQTTARTLASSATFSFINVDGGLNVDGLTIDNNFFGGTATTAGGGYLTLSGGILRGLLLSVGNTALTTVNGNNFRLISFTSNVSSALHSIVNVADGFVQVGTGAANTFGQSFVSASIIADLTGVTATSSFSAVLAGTGTTPGAGNVNIENNNFFGIGLAGASSGQAALNIIHLTGNTGLFTVSNNILGASGISTSINATSNNILRGIYSNATRTTATHTIASNTLVNLVHQGTGAAARVAGIFTDSTATSVHQITNNTISNLSGISATTTFVVAAGIVAMATTPNQVVSQNQVFNISSTTGTSAAVTVAGILVHGIVAGGNHTIERNRVHSLNINTTNTSASMLGIVVNSGTAAVRNNFVRLGITGTGASITSGIFIMGIQEGLQASLNALYNTVYIGGTGVAVGGGGTYGLLSLASTGSRTYRNNIFYNARSASAAGVVRHQAIAVQTATGLTANQNVYTAIGQNNVLASVGATLHPTLSAWRTATGQDAGSFSSYLTFVNATGNAAAVDLHINPTVETVVESNGAGVSTVNNDIDNDARSTTATPPTGTDIGADEGTFTAVATPRDIGISAFVTPDASGCFTSTQAITVTIQNFRSTAIPNGTPIPVEVTITGAITATLTGTYSGGIAASGTANFTVGTVDMSGLGVYNLRAIVNPAGSNEDVDISNDILQVTRTRIALAGGTVTVPPASSLFCVTGGTVTATVAGAAGGTIQWQTSPDNSTWTNVGTVNSLTYTTPGAITQTTFFRVRVSCGGSDVFSAVDTAVLANPTITSTTGATKCGPGTATILAVTPTAGAAINWFAAPTGGSIVGTGASFSPFINATTTFYASAEIATSGATVGTFGTSTTVNDATGTLSGAFPSPYTNWYGGNKHQMMIRAFELTGAGFTAGNITSLSFTIAAMGSDLIANPNLQNFTIGMKATSATTLSGTAFETGFITVLPQATLTLPNSGFPVEVIHTFTTPFFWDGVSNIVVQTAYTNGNFGDGNDFVQMRYSDPGFQATTVFRRDSNGDINTFLDAAVPTFSYSTRRPNMRITILNSCSSPRVPVTVTYTAPPALGISASAATICAGSSTTVNVTPATVGNFTTYAWSPTLNATPGGTPVGSSVALAPTATTKYILTATSGVCTNLDSVVVTVAPTPSPISGTNYITCVAATIPGGQGLEGNGSNLVSNIAGSVAVGATYNRSDGGTVYNASGTSVYFNTDSFTVTTTGIYTLNGCATSAYTDMHASIYQTSFNPASPATNFLLADDDGNVPPCGLGSRLTLNLTAGVTYVLVTSTFDATTTMDFDWTYTGPGSLQAGFSPSVYFWYANPTGGTALATGVTTFNPVGVAGSGVPNTNTAGTYTFYLAQNNGTCESTRTPVDLVIRPATALPTAILANGVNPLATCGGSNNVILTQSGGVLGGGATWQWHRNASFSDLLATTTNNNAQVTITQAAGTAQVYYLRAVGATCGPATASSSLTVPVTVNPNGTWIGTNTNWTDPANWCGGIPGATTNVAVPNYGVGGNYPVIAGGVAANVNNITLNVNARLTIQPTAALNISGTMINDGNILSRGTITLTGTGAQTFPGTGLGQVGYLNELVIDKASGTTALNRSFAVNGALIPTRGNIQIDSVITIRSTNDTTARVGIVGAGVNLTYDTAGRFSVERYVPAKRAWRLLTSPTTTATSQSINAAWQEGVTAWPMGVATGATNPNPGYGTHISGGTQANGYDQNVNGNASIRVFSSGWQNLSVATSLLSRKVTDERAYMVFVRGSRGLNMAQGQFAIPDVTTLRSSGRINVANATPFTVTSSGLTLAGNPFPSAISFKQLATDNGFLNDAARNVFYLWDPTLAGNRNVGAFVTVAYNIGTGNYDRSVTASGANYTTAGGNQGIDNQGTIQSGLGFFMNFGGTSNTVSFNEGIKVAGSTSAVFRPGPQIRATLRTRMADGSTPINDGVLVNFHPIFSNDADDNDVKKVDNFTENMSLWRDGTLFSIERRKPPVAGDTLHLRLRNLVINNFQFEFAPDSLIYPHLQAFLIDRHLGTETPISLKDTSRYNFTIAANPASIWAEDRFALVFKSNVGGSVIPVTITSVRAARRNQDISVDWNVENEINIRHYTVERSSDGRNFNDLGQVQASGRLISAYTWLDQQPFSGDNFYRIRYTNADGSIGYSRIVKVDAGKLGRSIVVYPNPVTDGIIGTEFRNMPAGVYQARLLNGAGQTVFLKNVTHPGGTALLQIQPDYFLVPGTYQLEITGADKSQQTIQVLVK